MNETDGANDVGVAEHRRGGVAEPSERSENGESQRIVYPCGDEPDVRYSRRAGWVARNVRT